MISDPYIHTDNSYLIAGSTPLGIEIVLLRTLDSLFLIIHFEYLGDLLQFNFAMKIAIEQKRRISVYW